MGNKPTMFTNNERIIRSEECINHERMLTELTWFSAGLSMASQVWVSFGINLLGIFTGYLAYSLCKKNWRGLVINILIFIMKISITIIMM